MLTPFLTVYFNRTHCNLKQKVEAIKTVQKNPGINSRTLGKMFECGKTQIGKILKQKDSLLSMYESNASGSSRAPDWGISKQ